MNYVDISEKKILLFAPAFFKYEEIIAEKMREMGAQVDVYDVRSVSGAMERALLKISPMFFYRKSLKYYESIIDTNKDREYDYILIIKCDMTPTRILKKLRKVFPGAKICLYLWDSVKNIPGIQEKFKFFDTAHSFDPYDCKKYAPLKFRPLFFADQFRKNEVNSSKYKYDLCFIGTIHSDRYKVIRQIQGIAKKKKLNCYWFLYLQSNFIYWFYKVVKKEFKGVYKTCFNFNKKTAEEISTIIEESNIVIDIQHPRQTGLTMRTMEILGMNKKLITTNKNIKKYDFYNADNIEIVDRRNVKISTKFLNTPYKSVPKQTYEKYSIEQWVYDVLS